MGAFSTLRMPSAIFYGQGSFQKVGEEAGLRGNRALIITDKIMDSLGYVEQCRENLSEHAIQSSVYLDIDSEPTDTYVEESLQIFSNDQCDLIISLGGGSCIDTAKAVSILASNGGYIGDYMGGKKNVTQDPIPHIAIPTTAGTGSEATDVTVITNTSTEVKMMIKQPAFMPEAAIVDPLLTRSSPKSVTAATGVDALSHALEAYISRKAHPMTDVLALSAMELIIKNIRQAYFHGDDLEAREAMSLGALQAGIAFSNSSVCLVHGMSRPIGALFHVPHGLSNAMLLPAVLEFSQENCQEQLTKIGEIVGKDDTAETNPAIRTVETVKKLCLDLDIPNLKEWGIEEEKFKQVTDKMAEDALASGSPGNNPRVPTKEEVKELYQACYDYRFTKNTTVI